ncbi:MAG: metallophosphoesterase [Clostridia bacterium]|nr:metallophosphoesterase [Clostridia bacterium]
MSSTDIYNVVSGSTVSGSNVVSGSDAGFSFTFGTTGVIITALVIFLLIMTALELLRSRYVLTVNRQFVTMDDLPQPFDGTKVAVVSDLHQMRFGEYNEDLAKRIRREKPSYIFFVGDMGDCAKYDVDAFYDLLESLGSETPIIMVPGDHDLALGGGIVHKNFISEIERAGAVLLNNTCAEMVSGGQKLYIYGFCQPLDEQKDVPATKWSFSEVDDKAVQKMLGKCPSDAPVILLAHDPRPFEYYAGWGASLVLSGHEHGGMLRLPFIGGIVGADKELRPRYSAGIYKRENSKLFVTRGLGSAHSLRFLNAPEIAILTLVRPDSELLEEQTEKSRIDAKSGVQLAVIKDWFVSEWRSIRELLDERLRQAQDFFALMMGKKRDRFARAADEKKRSNTYVARDKKRTASRRKAPSRYAPKDQKKR